MSCIISPYYSFYNNKFQRSTYFSSCLSILCIWRLGLTQGCQTHFSSGAAWSKSILTWAGKKKIFFSKKKAIKKIATATSSGHSSRQNTQTQTEQQLHIFMLCKIISRAALNPFAGRMHNIRKNPLAGRMRPAGRTFDIPGLTPQAV